MGTTCMQTAPATKPKAAPFAAPSESAGPTAVYTVGASLASGLLLWACFQPLALGTYVGWIALAPFLVLVRSQARPRFVYVCALVCGLAFFIPALQWMRVADRSMMAGWMALATYCALYFPIGLLGVRCLERWKFPLVVSVPLVWVALEYVRCFALTGFPWYLLGHTQHDWLHIIQITDIGGVFLVSLVVVAVNALLFDIAYQFPEVRQWLNQAELAPYRYYSKVEVLNRSILAECHFRRNLILEGLAVLMLLACTYAYGEARLSQDQFKPGPLVCLLQSNLDQRIREAAAREAGNPGETVEKHFAELIRHGANTIPKPDLMIWPETSYPNSWVEVSPKFPVERLNEPMANKYRNGEIEIREQLDDFAGKYTQIPHLLGMNAYHLDPNGRPLRFNTAILLKPVLQPNGRYLGRPDGKYDKIHRLPFGEYIPLQKWLPFLSWLTPYEGNFGIQEGEKFTRLEIAKHRFGVLICFEDSDPSLARRYVEDGDDGPPVDFLVNMSNDGWFDGSDEHEEHLAVSRFRAIECRRAMVRSVNMGVSAVIDGNGRVLRPEKFEGKVPAMWMVKENMERAKSLPVADWHKFKKTPMILIASVPIDHRFSFYAATGDWLPIGCWLALIGCTGWALVRRRMAAKATVVS
jgi:apolipoprotein N-acyltransferase